MGARIAIGGILVLVLSCKHFEEKKYESYGLPVVAIKMNPEDRSLLESTTFQKSPVSAKVKLDGKELAAEVSYAGKSTIDAYKKSFDVELKKPNEYLGRSSLRLSAQYTDPSQLKSLIGFYVFESLGLYTPKVVPIVVYFDDSYLGLYQLIEPVDEEFFDKRGLSLAKLFKAKYGNANFKKAMLQKPDDALSAKIKPKTFEEMQMLVELVTAPPSPENKAKLIEHLNVEIFLNYLAASVIINNWDGYDNNFFLYRLNGNKTYSIIPWDLDRIWEPEKSEDQFRSDATLWGGNQIMRHLLEYPEFKQKYLQILKKALSGPASIESLKAKLDQWQSAQEQAFASDAVLSSHGKTLSSENEKLQKTAHQEIEWLICQNLYNPANERQRSIRPDPGHLIPVVG